MKLRRQGIAVTPGQAARSQRQVRGLTFRAVVLPAALIFLGELVIMLALTGTPAGADLLVEALLDSLLLTTLVVPLFFLLVFLPMRRLHQEKVVAEELLRGSVDELSRFASAVAHDLKGPLQGIQHLTTWLAEDSGKEGDGQSERLVELVQTRVARMRGMIDGLLEYARLGADAPVENVELDGLLREVAEVIDRPTDYLFEFRQGAPAIVTNRARLRQVFFNLLANAVRFHHGPDGRAEVTCEDLGEWLRFTVRDNGPGLDSAHHEKIFELFTTLHRRDELDTTGMGLALVKRSVELQGGRIEVDSEPGEGAAFAFTWPKRPIGCPSPA